MKKFLIVIILLLNTTLCFSAEKSYILPEPVRTAIINYLSEQPYKEVAVGIQALLMLEELSPDASACEEPKSEVKK